MHKITVSFDFRMFLWKILKMMGKEMIKDVNHLENDIDLMKNVNKILDTESHA